MRFDSTFRELRDEDLDVLITVGKHQAALLDRLQELLESGDEQAALAVARQLCALEKTIKLS
jgi:hypothetical protein